MTLKKRKSKKSLDVDPKILKKIKEPKDVFLDDLDAELNESDKDDEMSTMLEDDKDN